MGDFLPAVAAEIAEVIGEAAALRLLEARGGTQISIPVRAEGSMLARLVGETEAQAMIDTFGPGKLTLPTAGARGVGARRARAMRMLRKGHSLQEVALACDLHTRTVSNYRAQIDRDNGQMELPFDS